MARKRNIPRTVLGLTTVAVLSLGLGESDIVPSKMYTTGKPVFESKYSWESQGGYFGSEYREIFDKYEIIHGFASKIIENSLDLDPAIVEFVTKNFWNLI
jgi:hypothetical protein